MTATIVRRVDPCETGAFLRGQELGREFREAARNIEVNMAVRPSLVDERWLDLAQGFASEARVAPLRDMTLALDLFSRLETEPERR